MERSRAEPAIADAQTSTRSSTEKEEERIEVKVNAPQSNFGSATTVQQTCATTVQQTAEVQMAAKCVASYNSATTIISNSTLSTEFDSRKANSEILKVKQKCEPVTQFWFPILAAPTSTTAMENSNTNHHVPRNIIHIAVYTKLDFHPDDLVRQRNDIAGALLWPS